MTKTERETFDMFESSKANEWFYNKWGPPHRKSPLLYWEP